VEANGSNVTLFLRLENLYAGKDASAFWYEARLFTDGETPDPDPDPNHDEIITALYSLGDRLAEIRDKL